MLFLPPNSLAIETSGSPTSLFHKTAEVLDVHVLRRGATNL
jgi:hypothetical protein